MPLGTIFPLDVPMSSFTTRCSTRTKYGTRGRDRHTTLFFFWLWRLCLSHDRVYHSTVGERQGARVFSTVVSVRAVLGAGEKVGREGRRGLVRLSYLCRAKELRPA